MRNEEALNAGAHIFLINYIFQKTDNEKNTLNELFLEEKNIKRSTSYFGLYPYPRGELVKNLPGFFTFLENPHPLALRF